MSSRMIERWLDTGRLGEQLDERTARILRDWENEGFCHYATTTDEKGHRQLMFRKAVAESASGCFAISLTSVDQSL